MPYSIRDLRTEIRDIIAATLAANQKVIKAWLITDILKQHPLGVIRDREFNVLCRYEAISRVTRDVLADMKLAADDPASVSKSGMMLLPGFKHLQRGYPIERDGELMIVPIALMTSVERRARAQQYRKMAVGCEEHADELDRYDDLLAA